MHKVCVNKKFINKTGSTQKWRLPIILINFSREKNQSKEWSYKKLSKRNPLKNYLTPHLVIWTSNFSCAKNELCLFECNRTLYKTSFGSFERQWELHFNYKKHFEYSLDLYFVSKTIDQTKAKNNSFVSVETTESSQMNVDSLLAYISGI